VEVAMELLEERRISLERERRLKSLLVPVPGNNH
jgi:hypothetical protein